MCLQIAGFPSFYFSFIYLYLFIYVIFFISTVDKHLGCFHIMALVNNAAMKIEVKMPLKDPNFISFGYTPRSGVADPGYCIP